MKISGRQIILTIGILFSVLLFFYSLIYFYNYYSMNNILWYIPNNLDKNSEKLNPNEIGDSIGGILNPVIGLLVSILTFLAFYMQKIANDEIKDQFKIQQFESQFYEMLRLHKENVNEIEIKTVDKDLLGGRQVFYEMKKELEILLTFTKDYFQKPLDNELFIYAYEKFFWGFNNEIKISKIPLTDTNFDENSFESELNKLKKLEKTQTSFDAEILKNNLKIPFLEGHHSYLGHYYRHLFYTVKFVVSKKFLSRELKLNYLRTLRAQLSNYEQIMLYYNWLSEYGNAWENKDNNFLTEYKMIHNLWYTELIDDSYIKENLKRLVEVYRGLGFKDDLFEMKDKKIFEE